MRAMLAVLLLLIGLPAMAAETASFTSPQSTASLVTDSDSIAAGKPLRVALRLRLAPGWHTYWRNPGDAGAAPTLAFTLPGGTAGPLEFPTPQVQHEGPLVTYAYAGDVLFPLTIANPAPGRMTAQADWLACRDICVPQEASFTLDLPAGDAVASRQASLFAAFDQAAPRSSPYAASIAPDGTLTLSGQDISPEAIAGARFFPLEEGRIRNDAEQRLTVSPGALYLHLTWTSDASRTAALPGLLILDDRKGNSAALQIQATPGTVSAEPASPGLLAVLGLAVLGGVILNLMPCVFPVLAVKAFALARLSGSARNRVRAEALSYTAGVLVAFALLGAFTIGLRGAGASVGWGFQFTSPVFVVATGWVLFTIGLNLSGVFEIGGSIVGAGQSLAGLGGHLGSFFTGLLAVVVATPCTAPFMGAALAAAMSAPPATALATFLALGVGLAAPTLVLAVAPGLAGLLPRPGRWMQVLRQALAFPMYAAAAWLVWVASQQAGSEAVLAMLAGGVLIAFAGWILCLGSEGSPRTRRTLRAAALAAVIGAIALLPGLASAPPVRSTLAQSEGAEPFSDARLASLRAAGRPVFVNLTAAWCVTCLINERVALHAPDVRKAFAADDITYLVGDWTRQDPGISRFLRAQSRDGVPLYLFYPPGGKPPVLLPQLLTAHTVLQAIGSES
jgi:thiol:disulfide interchange protein